MLFNVIYFLNGIGTILMLTKLHPHKLKKKNVNKYYDEKKTKKK